MAGSYNNSLRFLCRYGKIVKKKNEIIIITYHKYPSNQYCNQDCIP